MKKNNFSAFIKSRNSISSGDSEDQRLNISGLIRPDKYTFTMNSNKQSSPNHLATQDLKEQFSKLASKNGHFLEILTPNTESNIDRNQNKRYAVNRFDRLKKANSFSKANNNSIRTSKKPLLKIKS